ncbi:WASH complex subunit 2-like [Penaeus chinensis]|uniref:WASH complex subunit 2-like n=1 Tax=Penaeus chinensis TaxID=139456 RepID=UPI001FB820DB|nr:WASH complex subunit 2-like [Penaeus chinensis]
MGSAEGGSGSERWWESPTLTQADLRQYGESWSLAADAATATLLQSISQRLVSRTHEVEGALKKVLDETDSVMTAISNTNNSFHQLANTQFIENRTYQDDADVARDEPDKQEKVPPTEEEVIARCRSAIAEGLSLVSRSYERHEIQDSDSDDEDSPSSPVPVYALINPYEVKPLPHIIGTAMFMEDDKLGLQESSSDDSSKVTFSPEDTDTEEDLDMEDETDINQKHKPIPASSSRLMDDSDSDWSDEPVRTSNKNPQPPNMTSEDDDDDDDDFFGPSSKSFKQVNNGSNLSSELNKKLQSATATSQRVNEMDSDTDEDGDLFGCRPEPLASSNSTVPSSTASVSKPPSLGVENVRAMPDPAGVRLPAASGRLKKSEGNLFASDSDDEGDLFGPKPQPSGMIIKFSVLEHNQI